MNISEIKMVHTIVVDSNCQIVDMSAASDGTQPAYKKSTAGETHGIDVANDMMSILKDRVGWISISDVRTYKDVENNVAYCIYQVSGVNIPTVDKIEFLRSLASVEEVRGAFTAFSRFDIGDDSLRSRRQVIIYGYSPKSKTFVYDNSEEYCQYYDMYLNMPEVNDYSIPPAMASNMRVDASTFVKILSACGECPDIYLYINDDALDLQTFDGQLSDTVAPLRYNALGSDNFGCEHLKIAMLIHLFSELSYSEGNNPWSKFPTTPTV